MISPNTLLLSTNPNRHHQERVVSFVLLKFLATRIKTNSLSTHCLAPPIVIVTQPAADPNRVPELFEADAKNWLLFCGLGYFAGWCTACYLGMKYQVQ